MFLNEIQAFFCFFMFFRTNVFQVKLDITLIIIRSNSFGTIYNIQKEKYIHETSEAATLRFSTK